ncbi:MAG: DMT superfamily transporter [Roseibaca calidilacus]|uniref:Chloramphenicol-sensitive protein RarD n=1 Tax=Roseibaca calidilacus TaxID=1666912 RepID=A0A0P8AEI9_9RHOB|nr:EamA family transporter RarD [Roseibaca calidilacus]KPP92666.1 MAG: DMT superfamily transporter [Roseibaca calidilacus]CUX80261.1 chloramphenicol-sensitive protein RarD [Roseibaca calidilacus]
MNEDTPRGFAFALGAFAIWGMLPFYFRALGHVPTPEVVAHRVIWAVPVALGWLLYLGRTADLRLAIRTPRMLGMAVVTAALISLNWGAYVWLIQSGQAMEAALGYYINPIFSVFLGSIFLGERLSARQWGAVALAFAAVVVLTVEAGSLPLGALVLVFSWGGYAFFKRALPIGPNQGFALEALILLPVALAFMGWQAAQGNLFAAQASGVDWLLLLGCGVITAVPLILYANGAKGLRLSTIAISGYAIPTMIFLISTLAFQEPFEGARLIAFPMIWAAMALYIWEVLRKRRAARA